MRPIIYSYKIGSKSARALQKELQLHGHKALRVKPDGKYKPFSSHLVINWGNSKLPEWPRHVANWLNDPFNVAGASNKLIAFALMKEGGVSVPEFTTDKVVATNWETIIVQRTKLTGHSGDGIIISNPHEGIICLEAPLYVKYVKKSKEYRVHVFKGKVIDIQQKRKRQEVANEDVDYKVRNHANGWVYCRSNVSPDQSVLDNALAAVSSLGLDFGAVDVIWNKHYSKAYVLEVNTAPGLEGTTLINYRNAIEELL